MTYSVLLSPIDKQTSLTFTNAAKGQLPRGGCIYSPQQTFRLRFQESDNNVIIDAIDDSKIPNQLSAAPLPAANFNWIPIWSIYVQENIAGIVGEASFVVQQDGNVVVYDGDKNHRWSTNTQGNSGVALMMQDDGNLVVYNAGKALWATFTNAGSADRQHAGPV